VRAPQVAGSRLAPFYDDVILVRRVKAGVPEGEAIVVFAAQVKSGDRSSAAVIDQIRRDIMREQGGLIELDGRLYRLLPAPNEFPPMRVFVGTLLPPAEAVTTLPVPLDFRILPKGGEVLETIARGFLEANELLP
jgi:hypothetical protein